MFILTELLLIPVPNQFFSPQFSPYPLCPWTDWLKIKSKKGGRSTIWNDLGPFSLYNFFFIPFTFKAPLFPDSHPPFPVFTVIFFYPLAVLLWCKRNPPSLSVMFVGKSLIFFKLSCSLKFLVFILVNWIFKCGNNLRCFKALQRRKKLKIELIFWIKVINFMQEEFFKINF